MWIGEYMAREGIGAAELAARAREYDKMANPKAPGRITEALIELLEMKRGYGVTLPRFANAIAAVCGATSAQRDMIVDERHRGKWTPNEKVRARAEEAVRRVILRRYGRRNRATVTQAEPEKRDEAPLQTHVSNIKPVVMVDACGQVVRRFDSVKNAAAYCGTSTDAVGRRARREIIENELRQFNGYTFRFTAEWEAMTDEQRAEDLKRTLRGQSGRQKKGRDGNHIRPVTVTGRDGAVTRYPSVKEAAKACGRSACTVSAYLKSGVRDSEGRLFEFSDRSGEPRSPQ